MRLKQRSVRLWNESYLAYRFMWQHLDSAAARALRELPSSSRRVLDLGCGQKPYADLFRDCEHIGLNPVTNDASPDVVGDALALPFAPECIDLVFCTQVLEHVADPQRLLTECHRVLRPGGWMILSAPFFWPLHEEPWDYYRYTEHGLRHLVGAAQFELIDLQADGGDGSRLMVSLLQALPRWASLLARVPANLLALALDRSAKRPLLPLNYTLLARRPLTATN